MAEGAWMPAVGNVATVMCFSICLILNVNLTGGLFLLASILLLLNQDSYFVAGFGWLAKRFFVIVVISSYLVLTALHSIWEEVWHGNSGGAWRFVDQTGFCSKKWGSSYSYISNISKPYSFQPVCAELHEAERHSTSADSSSESADHHNYRCD